MTASRPNIALVARMGSGKTTLAEHLEVGYGYRRVALAGEVKADAAMMLQTLTDEYFACGWLPDRRGEGGSRSPHITIADIETNKAVFRPFLQWLGTDFVRRFLGLEDHWIRRFLERAEDINALGQPVVCDDVRFPNEAEALRAAGFVVVRVVRAEGERLAFLRAKAEALGLPPAETQGVLDGWAAHPSETEQDAIEDDAVFYNTGAIDTMGTKVDLLANRLRGRVPA